MRFNRLPEFMGMYIFHAGDLRSWPQVFRGSPEFCDTLGHAPLNAAVKDALGCLTQRWRHIVVDTRVSMLMPGMYPCIPGWHCDDFWRPGGGQPDLVGAPEQEHIIMNLGDCSNTRFVAEPISLDVNEKAGTVRNLYARLHEEIEALKPDTFCVVPGDIHRMYQTTWHRGEPAHKPGWRVFFRLTGSNHHEAKDEVRTQSQVYLTDLTAGW